MDTSSLAETLETTVDIAKEAGQLILSGFRNGAEVRKKGEIDLVTDYDLKSEALIRKRLADAFPEHHVIGEEGQDDVPPPDDSWVWYVDPIDGTTNFAHGHPFFAVSIGLCKGSEPWVGVVHAPALDVLWQGARGQGAQRNETPCRVSAKSVMLDALAATGFAYDQTVEDDNTAEARVFLKRTHGFRRCGSAAIDLAMVADGTYDFYWEKNLKPWDLAAGTMLVEAAGGRVTDFTGAAADLRSGRLLASNGVLHDEALAIIREARTAAGWTD